MNILMAIILFFLVIDSVLGIVVLVIALNNRRRSLMNKMNIENIIKSFKNEQT